MKVLLLSAYAARSHVHWQLNLQKMFAQWQWRVLTLPPRHFSWRVRGNALYWSIAERDTLEDDYDLVIATSMVDMATLRGLVPALTRVPTIVYFHENQFEYPQLRQQHSLLEAQMTSIYSALSADSILFNSQYNRDTFLSGCIALLGKLPDRVPPDVVPTLQGKASVLPVPFDHGALVTVMPQWPSRLQPLTGRPMRLLWVGRFEHDKGGEGLLRILHRLEEEGLDYELAMTGQQFREAPAVFNRIETSFSHRLVQFGYIEGITQYQSLLQAADVVLSTALHEFQGLAVMEAVAYGCVPVVPDRLVYPEIYSRRYRYGSHPEDPDREAASAASLILQVAKELTEKCARVPDVSAFSMRHLAPLYEQLLLDTVYSRDSQ